MKERTRCLYQRWRQLRILAPFKWTSDVDWDQQISTFSYVTWLKTITYSTNPEIIRSSCSSKKAYSISKMKAVVESAKMKILLGQHTKALTSSIRTLRVCGLFSIISRWRSPLSRMGVRHGEVSTDYWNLFFFVVIGLWSTVFHW